jgi:8-oxo-dGTP pyrophosphatase MutT (NUDIX family)
MTPREGDTFAVALQHPTMARMITRLTAHVVVEAPIEPAVRLAAVAAVLRVSDVPELLFIKRADAVGDPWSGHMAFPGGRYEPGDTTLLETAVRETLEETSINLLTHGRVLGALDDLAPRSPSLPRINIRPYVAIVRPDVEILPSDEVAAHFWVPLDALRAPATQAEYEMEFDGSRIRFPGYRVGPHIAWGLTERIVRQLLGFLDD